MTVSAGGRYKAAVTARCGWVEVRECGELIWGRSLPLKLKAAVYKSYVRPVIFLTVVQHGRQRYGNFSKVRVIHIESNVCGLPLKDRQKSYGLNDDAGFE